MESFYVMTETELQASAGGISSPKKYVELDNQDARNRFDSENN